MPSDRIRQDEMTGDLGPDYLKGRRGAAGSDLGGQGFGGQGFGNDPDEAPRRSRLLPLLIAFFALAAFAGIVWYAYEWGVGEVEPEHLPVVQAPSGPIKEKPAEPGGLEVPYTDSAVLNPAGEGERTSRIESLLPPPEEPVEVPPAPVEPEPAAQQAEAEPVRDESAQPGASPEPAPGPAPQPVSEPVSDTAALPDLPSAGSSPAATDAPEPESAAVQEEAGQESAEAVEPSTPAPGPEPVAEQPVAEQPVVAPEPVAEAPAETGVTAQDAPAQDAPAQEAPAQDPAAAEEPRPAAEVAPGSWVVQLAALRQEPAARQEWARIQQANGALLGSMSLLLERADLGERGIYYRIQTGPLPNRATALDLCAQLKAAGQDCIAKQR